MGNDFNEDLLLALAEAGGGTFHYIENPDQIPAIFAAELQGLLAVAGQALQLRFETAPGVEISEVIGYPPSGSPTDLTMPLPDIYAGETKSTVLCLNVAAPPAAAQPLLQVTLNYLPAEDGAQPVQEAVTVTAVVSDDPALLAAPPDPEVLRQAGLARAAQAAEEAVRVADAGDAAAGAQVLEHAAAHLVAAAPLDSVAAAEAAMLREQAAHMRAQGYDAGLRKRLRHQSHPTRSGRPVPPRA